MMRARQSRPSRTVALLAACVMVFLIFPGTAQAEDGDLAVLGVDTTTSPRISITVSTPPELSGAVLNASDFEVRESGALRKARVTGVPSDPFDVVMVLDTSGSMRGAALEASKAAATQLLVGLPPDVAVAIVGFGSAPYTVSGFSTDRTLLASQIERLEASGETALYDAVTVGSELAARAEKAALVLLSDGKDTASAGSFEQATTALVASKASFYAVLLQTAEQGIPALDALTVASSGQLLETTDPNALANIYGSIAGELSNQYILEIRAIGIGSIGFTIRAKSAGVAASGSTRIMVPPHNSITTEVIIAAPKVITIEEPGFAGKMPMLIIGLVALFVGLLVFGLLMFRPRDDPSQLTSNRAVKADGSSISELADRATSYAQEKLEKSGKAGHLNVALERAGIAMRPGEFVVLQLTVTFSAFALFYLLTNAIVGLVIAFATFFGVRYYINHKASRRRRKFGEQLDQTLPLIASGLRAGFGLMQAVDAVATESESPTSEEFRRVVTETRMGRDLVDSLQAMADRVDDDDFRWVVQAIDIHRQVGGDLAEVLDNVDKTIRDRNHVRRQVAAMSGEGRLSAIILFLLPLGMCVVLQFINPEYFGELTSSSAGIAMLIGGGVLMLLGGLWMRRITRLVF